MTVTNNDNNDKNNNDEKVEAPKLIGSKSVDVGGLSLENKKPKSKPYLSSWAMKARIELISVRNALVVTE